MKPRTTLSSAISAPARVHSLAVEELEPDFALLVEKTIAAILAANQKEDLVFGPFNGLRTVLQSISYHEGRLLEAGLLRIARCNPDLLVLPQNKAMPIVQAALDILERNEWEKLDGIRLNSQVHAVQWYTPDLLIVHRPTQSVLIADVKRSVSSYEGRRLDALLKRMMAAGLTAASWIYAEYKGLLIADVRIAIIDGSNEATEEKSGVFAMSALDALLHIDGAGAAMEILRAKFARRVQQELESLCRILVASLNRPAIAAATGQHGQHVSLDEHEAQEGDPGSDGRTHLGSAKTSSGRALAQPELAAAVKVGLARMTAH